MKLIKALWKGEVSLATTFFIYGWAIIFILNFIDLAIIRPSSYSGAKVLIPSTFNSIKLLYLFFIGVSIWRSANNFKGNVIWAGLAKVLSLGVWMSCLSCILYYAELDERIFGVVIFMIVSTGIILYCINRDPYKSYIYSWMNSLFKENIK